MLGSSVAEPDASPARNPRWFASDAYAIASCESVWG